MVFHNEAEVLETEIYSYSSEHAHDMASRSLVGRFQEQKLASNFSLLGEVPCRWGHSGSEADFNLQRLPTQQDHNVCLIE